MAQKIKHKPKPNYDRKAKHPDYVQFRCNAYAFNNIIRDIKDKLNERQKKLLKKTPFLNLIELFYHQRIDMNNMNKSDLDLVQLLKTFDPDTKSFKFGTKSFQITGNAVTQILGLPNEGLQQSSDEDEGQKKPTKKKLGWGQRKVWQKIPKADRERIEKHYLSTQPRDIFWAGLNSEKVTNHDLKDIVWDLELSQNVIEAYIQIEEDKIEPMQTESPQYMSTWTWAYMQSFQEPFWHRALYEHLLEKLGKCSVLFFPIISKEEFHFTLLTFHKNERKWRHYNPLRSLGHRKEERCIDIARNFVNIVEGWLEYIRPQARVFIETKKKPTLVKQKEGLPTLVQKDLTPTEELTLNWIMQNPLQFPFEDDMECAQQSVSSLDCGMFVMFYMDKIAQGQPIPKSVDKKFMNEYRAQYVTKLLHHKNCVINPL
ncbi:uncharacterized protein LOC117618382 [Prunus dulcis]|uniref:uncharacterized protein LOC117618382 n=1 Tax=Prunus dulcis TaxID=3755 RepID=UPI001483C1CE|nr:uncharacterized protein LOC117618382 [Prunus dulcis]